MKIIQIIVLILAINLNANPLVHNKLEKDCLDGMAENCADLAFEYEQSSIFTKDYNKTVYFYKKACALDAKECGGLAKLYASGKGINRSIKKAFILDTKACKSGAMYSCLQLGIKYKDGKSIEQNYIKAVIFFQKVCDSNDTIKWTGCSYLGDMYKDGFGVSKDISMALKYFKGSCQKSKLPFSCIKLGDLYRKGDNVEKNITKASYFYTKACPENKGKQCNQYLFITPFK